MNPQSLESWREHSITEKFKEWLTKERRMVAEYLATGGVSGPSDELVQNYKLYVGQVNTIDLILKSDFFSKEGAESDE